MFPETKWTLLLDANNGDSLALSRAREDVFQRYWQPLYFYARSCGKCQDDAEDLVQSFLVRLLMGDGLSSADPAKGRFRTFLLTSFKRFMVNEWRKGQAEKRGGGVSFISSHDLIETEEHYRSSQKPQEAPEIAFDRQWAKTIVSHALRTLEETWNRTGKRELFQALQPFLTLDAESSIAEIASQLDRQPSSVRTSLSRLRSEFRYTIGSVVRETLDVGEDDIEEEVRYLVGLLRSR